jgi:hypothetical protein
MCICVHKYVFWKLFLWDFSLIERPMDIMFFLGIKFNYTCDSCNCLIRNSFWYANIFNEHDKCTYGYVAYVVERLVV